ncbi:MAG TPA: phosphodiester glycosidase family protein [Candidatus Elarobacter sp.]|nr:phosphodiester glycosidase family protein [Candidatus Elarobacter sp.]
MFGALYALGAVTVLAGAGVPERLAPGAPFPAVVSGSVEREAVAPGIERATYRVLTAAGPLVISVVAVDPREPAARIGSVLANDRIVSKDETTSSMARRTGAVAGINGDYFDINATGAPVGILVRGGALLRTPSTRPALTVTRDGQVRFETYAFSGSVTFGPVTVPLSAVNEWPPQGGVALLTPAFGGIPASGDGIVVLDADPVDGAGGPNYRVAAVTSGPPWPPPPDPLALAPRVRLAYGPAAQGFGPLPGPGDVISLAFGTNPPLADVEAAVGGGPLLLRNGAAVDDPASPNYADRARRIPAAAAARLPDGTLLLVVVDGRHPATSIGVNRAELIALLRALGATDAMLFDSGGSATLVARVLGDSAASVVNEPSDGVERPVADGLFVYSTAPEGPPARLVVRPEHIVALPGAHVPLRARIVDANLHGLGDARGPWRVAPSPLVASIGEDDVMLTGPRPGSASLRVARGGVAGTVGVELVDRVARIAIGPPRANPDPHAALPLTVQAFDARDRPVAVGGLVRWSANGATVDAQGRLVAGERDAVVTASAGGASATVTIPVGRHDVPLALFDERNATSWTLVTAPADSPGAVDAGAGRLRIAYDFTGGERAAYATNEIPLGEPLALSCAVDGDGTGAALRATFADRYGDRDTATFARAIDFTGTRRLTAKVPRALAPPIALRNLYVVGTLASPPIAASGAIVVHDCVETLPGAQAP